MVIGSSSFEGPANDPQKAIEFAKSIGADIVLTSLEYSRTKNSSYTMTLPDTTTYNFSGYGGGSNFYGSGTSYGSTTTTVPISIDRFNQGAMYLKNVNAVQPLWEGRIEAVSYTHLTLPTICSV